ncbi:MAG: LLM class flavin-dependent oxidoreductase [Microbacterium sp.]
MTPQQRRLGAIFIPDLPPEGLREAVLAAEAAGVDELWLWEDCFREAAFSSAGAALAWTERLRIGIGIAPMPLRNVALTAMEIATLERMFPGRLLPGVGHGVLSWMGQVGARVSSPLTLMREYIPALRSLLAGESVTMDGRYVHLEDVRLDWPPATAPIVYAAGEGPKTLALTGEVADATVLTGGTTPEQVAAARDLIAGGRSLAGRDGEHPVVVYVAVAFGTVAAARAEAQLAEWGMPDQPHRILAGEPARVAAAAERYYEAGADAVILQPLPNEDDLVAFLEGVAGVASHQG